MAAKISIFLLVYPAMFFEMRRNLKNFEWISCRYLFQHSFTIRLHILHNFSRKKPRKLGRPRHRFVAVFNTGCACLSGHFRGASSHHDKKATTTQLPFWWVGASRDLLKQKSHSYYYLFILIRARIFSIKHTKMSEMSKIVKKV